MQSLYNSPSAIPNEIENSIREYLEKDTFHIKRRTDSNDLHKKKEALTKSHLAQFISTYNEKVQAPSRKAVLKAECFLTMNKWSELIRKCRLINISPLTPSDINQFYLGEGICTGNVIEYFSDFFSSHSPLDSPLFPISLNSQNQDLDPCVNFFPFIFSQETIENSTSKARFLQAAYKVAYALKKEDNFMEFVPHGILKEKKLKIVKRIPDSKTSQEYAFPIQHLIVELKQLSTQESQSGYLLGLSGPANHALALHLNPPFHFLDPKYGIAIASSTEDLILFLAAHLTEKYSNHDAFALLEIASSTLSS